MKRIINILAALFCMQAAFAQQAEVSTDYEGNKVIRGFMSKKDLATDTAFKWFAANQKGYTPVPNAVQALQANKDSVNIIVFGGTWCHDTQFILPKFFSLAETAGFSEDRITMIGVDRGKKTIQHLAEAFNVTNVPTIIVMKNGKETGRVVEYGRYGLFDKELGEILNNGTKK